MATNGCRTVVWLEDEVDTIEEAVQFLKKRGIEVTVRESSSKVLQDIRKPDFPDLLIVDLKIPSEDGLAVAQSAKTIRPSLPIIAVTQFLNEYAETIVSEALTSQKRPFPLLKIWQKSDLTSKSEIKGFAEQIDMICSSEYHEGEVTLVECDYMAVQLETPRKEKYVRLFDREFLERCGISKAGEQVGIFFWKNANGKWGQTGMQIKKIGRPMMEKEHEIAARVYSKLDMKKISKAFPSAIPKKGARREHSDVEIS